MDSKSFDLERSYMSISISMQFKSMKIHSNNIHYGSNIFSAMQSLPIEKVKNDTPSHLTTLSSLKYLQIQLQLRRRWSTQKNKSKQISSKKFICNTWPTALWNSMSNVPIFSHRWYCMVNEDNLTDWASFSFEFKIRYGSTSRSCARGYSAIAGNDIERDIIIIISGSKSFTLIASLHS